MMMHALRRGRPGPRANVGTRYLWALATSGRDSGQQTTISVMELSKDRTLIRVTQGDTVVLASLRESAEGRATGRGVLEVEYKERSFASRHDYRRGHRYDRQLDPQHHHRTEVLMTDAERAVASRIRRMMAASTMGVPAKRRLSAKLTVLAAGRDDPELVAVYAASALLEASGMPWFGPFGAARVVFGSGHSSEVTVPRVSMTREGDDGNEGDGGGSDGSMVVACDAEGNVLHLRGFVSTPRSTEEVIEGLRVAQAYIVGRLAGEEQKFSPRKRISVAGSDPAAGRQVREQIVERLDAYLAARNGGGSLGDLHRHIESTVKPDIVEGLQRQGRWRHETSRIKGSGCVTMQDLDYTIDGTLQELLREDRDRREPHDEVEETHIELNHVPASHAASLYTSANFIVESAVTCVRGPPAEHLETSTSSTCHSSPRVSSVFLTCSHGTSGESTLDSSRARGTNHSDDVDRASFVRDAVSRMLPSPDVLPFAFRTNSEVLRCDARGGMGSVAAAINGMSVAVNLSLLQGFLRKTKNKLLMPWTAAAIGLSFKYPPGTLDGEEHEIALDEHGKVERVPIDGFDVLRDVGGVASLITDAELTVVGPSGLGEPSVSGWMLHCYAPTRVSLEMLQRGIETAINVREARLKELQKPCYAHAVGTDHAVFGELSVSTASMPKLLVDRSASLRKIEESTGGIIHVKEPGVLSLFAPSAEAYEELEELVSAASGAFLVPNRTYRATVTAVRDFGAFVLLPRCDIEAMLHISELSHERIASIDDEIAVGDVIDVMFLGEDGQGGLRVSKRKAIERIA